MIDIFMDKIIEVVHKYIPRKHYSLKGKDAVRTRGCEMIWEKTQIVG